MEKVTYFALDIMFGLMILAGIMLLLGLIGFLVWQAIHLIAGVSCIGCCG